MEFRTYAANETSALVTRLLAARSDTAAQQVRALRDALDATARAIEGAAPEIAGDVEELVKRLTNAAAVVVKTTSQRIRDEAQVALDGARTELDGARAELEAERAQSARLAVSVEKAEAESIGLLADLQNERDRADAAHRDLAAVLEANKQLEADHLEIQSACAMESQAKAAVETELREARALLDAAFDDAARLNELLQAEATETSALKGELVEVYGQLETARSMAEAAAAGELNTRTALESELHEVRSSLDVALAEDARLGAQLEASVAEKGKLLAALSAAQGQLHTADEQRDAIASQLKASNARIQALERSQAKHDETVRQLQARLDGALKTEAGLRERAVSGDRETAGVRSELETLRGEADRLRSLFDASLDGLDELADAATVSELLAALLRQLSTRFSRVALFRVKSNRLEGEHQVGFDQSTDVTKLVMPLSVDSPLTRVVKSGVVETLTGTELTDGRGVPFAGTSAAALALPVVLQGQTFAVVYADHEGQPASGNGAAVHESTAKFARLLVQQSAVLLTRMTHELKTLTELRDYAALLLQEAERMHTADADAGTSDDQLRSRLKDSLDCARALYAQRASLEGPAAAALLDEQIAAAVQARNGTPFARDLAALVGHTGDATSRRAAEAS